MQVSHLRATGQGSQRHLILNTDLKQPADAKSFEEAFSITPKAAQVSAPKLSPRQLV
jgi:hypothetical protein